MATSKPISPATVIKDSAGRDWSWAFVLFKRIPMDSRYAVGSDGAVWRYRDYKRNNAAYWYRLSPGVNKPQGHRYVILWSIKPKPIKLYVHRLVYELFIGPIPVGLEVCHNDGRPWNNRVGNLRADTSKNNHADKKRHGTYQWGETASATKLTADQVRTIRRMRGEGMRQEDIASLFGVSRPTISDACSGRTWAHLDAESGLAIESR